MEFKLTTTGDYYSKEDADALESLGFKFEYMNMGYFKKKYRKIVDRVPLTVTSLEELLDFVNEWGEIVISEDVDPGRYQIEIYDGYRE